MGRVMQDKIICGDALEALHGLPDQSVHCCVTSPPYWGLRDYGVDGQLGLEKTPEEYVDKLVEVFREVRRVLRDDGTLWLNLGDSYATSPPGNKPNTTALSSGLPNSIKNQEMRRSAQAHKRNYGSLKPKNLVGIPWSVAFALRSDGWWLRSDIIWAKPNPMPESVRDRPTKSHEYIFLLAKSRKYYYDQDAIREPHAAADPAQSAYRPAYAERAAKHKRFEGEGKYGKAAFQSFHPKGRNKRDVWWVSTKPFKGAHFAVFPPGLIRPCILAGCPEGGIVLDPFFGAGTVGVVAKQEKRHYIGIELNPDYVKMAKERIARECPLELRLPI